MKYERLTKWEDKNAASVNGSSPLDKDFAKAIKRLAELEDKIEGGTLIELPCKVGDKVCKFIVKENKQFLIIEAVCIKIEISRKGVLYMFSTLTSRYLHENFFGKLSDDFIDVEQYYICTKEEAEARLAELRGNA